MSFILYLSLSCGVSSSLYLFLDLSLHFQNDLLSWLQKVFTTPALQILLYSLHTEQKCDLWHLICCFLHCFDKLLVSAKSKSDIFHSLWVSVHCASVTIVTIVVISQNNIKSLVLCLKGDIFSKCHNFCGNVCVCPPQTLPLITPTYL